MTGYLEKVARMMGFNATNGNYSVPFEPVDDGDSSARQSANDAIVNLLSNLSNADTYHLSADMSYLNNNSSIYLNSTYHSPAAPSSDLLSLIAYCFILPSICVLGILGNIANLITLYSPRLRRQVSYSYLRALACADLVCMTFVFQFCTFSVLSKTDIKITAHWAAFHQAKIMFTIINWSVSIGNLIVVALTVERYFSVCHPIRFRTWNSPKRATTAILMAVMVPSMLFIPYGAFRYDVGPILVLNETMGYKKLDGVYHKTSAYQFYEYTREGLLKFAPLFTLAILNLMIMIAFRKRTAMRQRMRHNNRAGTTVTREPDSFIGGANPPLTGAPVALQKQHSLIQKSNSSIGRLTQIRKNFSRGANTDDGSQREKDRNAQRDDALLLLLACIVLMFFICNIPAAINLILINEQRASETGYIMFRATANLLEIANHALNFYVFCMCSSEYRTTFLEKFPMVRRLIQSWKRWKRHLCRRLTGHADGDGSELDGATTAVTGCTNAPTTNMTSRAGFKNEQEMTEDDDSSELTTLKSQLQSTPNRKNTHTKKDGQIIREVSEPTEADQLLGSRDTFAFAELSDNGDIKFITDSDDEDLANQDTML